MANIRNAGDNVIKLVRSQPRKRFEPWLFGPLLFVDDEEEERFESLSLEYHARYKPVGEIEEEYVDDLVDIVWRQRRMCELEMIVLETMTGMIEKDADMPLPSLGTMCRYKDQLDRSKKLVLKALDQVRIRREPDAKPTDRNMPHPAELKWLAARLHERDESEDDKRDIRGGSGLYLVDDD